MRRGLFPTLVLLAGLGLTANPLSAFDYTATATHLWTENLGRAAARPDFRDTSVIETHLAASHTRQLAPGLGGTLRLEASTVSVPDHDLADEATFGPRAILRRKFGLGPRAPILSIETAALGKLARIDENSGVTLQGSITLAKRLNPFFSAQLRGDWQEHVADASTFDVHHLGIEAKLSFDPTDRLRFSVGGGHLSGTFTVGASGARFAGALGGALGPDVAAYFAGRPREVTDAFGPGWVAYRVEGDVDFFFLEFSPALTDSLALAVRYERNHAVNIVDVEYRQDIFSLGVIYRF